MEELAKVNRFELIDHTEGGNGRVFVRYAENIKVETSLQDNERTLKIFITDTKAPIPIRKNEVKQMHAYSLVRESVGATPTKKEQELLDKFKEILGA